MNEFILVVSTILLVYGLYLLLSKRNSIKYNGENYTRKYLDEIIHLDIANNQLFDENNLEINLDESLSNELTNEQKEEFENWKTKAKASSWKSRQRKLRKEGKLAKYKIDALNKAGMSWDPLYDEWEYYYELFKTHGLNIVIKDWVFEQRKRYEDNDLEKENLYRLQAVKFPFKPQKNEDFKVPKFIIYEMIEAMDKGKKTFEYGFVKKEPIRTVSTKKENIGLNVNEINKLKREIDSLFNRKKSPSHYGMDRDILIDIYYDSFMYLKGEYEDKKGKKIKFVCPDEVKIYAAEKSIELLDKKLLKSSWFNRVKVFPPINKYISYYDKQRNKEKLLFMDNLVKKYPVLKMIYSERMVRVMKKYT